MGIQLVLRIMLIVLLLWVIKAASAQVVSLAKPGCEDKCGNVTIPYPFGIGLHCSANESFVISCNHYTPFLNVSNVEVLGISLSGTLTVNLPNVNLSTTLPFSDTYPQFYWTYVPGNSSTSFQIYYQRTTGGKNITSHQFYCNYGYDGNPYLPDGCQDVNECEITNDNRTDPCYGGACYYRPERNVSSRCLAGTCHNTPGSYYCTCPSGYIRTGSRNSYCYKLKDYKARMKDNRARMAIIGTSTGLGVLILLIGTWRLYKVMKKRNKAKLKKKYFKRNGGLLLQQQLHSSEEGNVEKIKLFTSKELEKATDRYNKNRILGQGGQGTVYKGMLLDGGIVAVKKSKIEEEEGKLEQFINEVIILSQINHRNVVKLYGCCLETEVPLLVYEFIPNGTLFDYIHDDHNEDLFPLSCWDMRLRISTEVAGALSYIHSAASPQIYHRDIKSTNILLDDKYRAKVADFGTSRSIAIDQTHLTTRVTGTFGYLDPEYFQSSQFTDKSDVYSFGVVLVELLTGQKPISSTGSDKEGRSLATNFILAMKETRLFDILDARVVKEAEKEEIIGVANLAKRCLNLNGRKRPTMKEVAMELERIRKSHGTPTTIQQNFEEEVEFQTSELTGIWDTGSTSTSTSTRCSLVSSSLDVKPLLFE